jgi:hypothetical protein
VSRGRAVLRSSFEPRMCFRTVRLHNMNPETAVHGIKLEGYLREGVLPPGLCVYVG